MTQQKENAKNSLNDLISRIIVAKISKFPSKIIIDMLTFLPYLQRNI